MTMQNVGQLCGKRGENTILQTLLELFYVILLYKRPYTKKCFQSNDLLFEITLEDKKTMKIYRMMSCFVTSFILTFSIVGKYFLCCRVCVWSWIEWVAMLDLIVCIIMLQREYSLMVRNHMKHYLYLETLMQIQEIPINSISQLTL